MLCTLCGFLRVSSWRIACATTLIDRYASRKAAQVLHGGGTFSNSGNRWFDKTLQVGMRTWMARDGLFRAADAECWLVSVFEQFVVGEDGSWGLLYEQATAEGPPVATLLDHVIEYWWDVGMKLEMCWISQEKLSWGGEWWGVCSECLRFFFLVCSEKPDTKRAPLLPLPMPKKLYFHIDREIKRDIEHAKQNLDM